MGRNTNRGTPNVWVHFNFLFLEIYDGTASDEFETHGCITSKWQFFVQRLKRFAPTRSAGSDAWNAATTTSVFSNVRR